MKRQHAFIVVALLAVAMPRTGAQVNTDLLMEVQPPLAAAVDPGLTVLRRRWVTLNDERIRETLPRTLGGASTSQQLVLNLFPDARFIAILDRVETTVTGYVWVGHFQEMELSTVTLAVTNGVLAGTVTTPDATYAIRYVNDGIYLVQELNTAAYPPEAPPVVPDLPLTNDTVPPIATDDGSIIDVLVVYTPAARSASGGTSAIQALVDLGISETNQAYTNSGAVQRIGLVHKQEVSYTEASSISADLQRLQAVSDGFLDSVHSLRDTYRADLVQLIVVTPNPCGIGYLMQTPSSSFAPFAFSVTDYSCVSPNYTFAHEMGHNMGLHHDIYVTGSGVSGAFPYSRGYVNQAAFSVGAPSSKRWRDIMAYNDQCAASGFNCSRILYFANPLKTFGGDPMGNASTADGVTTLDNTRVTIANFRASVSSSFTLTLTKRGSGTGTVTSSPAGINCGGTCQAIFTSGTPVALSTSASTDSNFTSWSGDADCLDGSVTMSTNRTCTAKFTRRFTDETLISGSSVVKATHITELRTRINDVRTRCGLGVFSWTNPSLTAGVTTIRALEVSELRAALNAAYTACGQTVPIYTDPALTPGSMVIKAIHITELRGDVISLE